MPKPDTSAAGPGATEAAPFGSTPKKNPMQLKLDELAHRWGRYLADPRKRLLRWLVDPVDVEIVDLFVDLQMGDAGDIPDLFVRFDEPFTTINAYSFDLMKSLAAKYEEIKTALRDESIGAGWVCPSPYKGEPPTHSYARCLTSFYDYYKDIMRNLAVVLCPGRISDMTLWQTWLRYLVRSGLPMQIRHLVLDDATHPTLGELAAVEPEPILSEKLDINHPKLMEEMAKGTKPGPSADFRVAFVKLASKSGTGDLSGAKAAAAEALSIAKTHNWFPMQVVIHTTLAAAYLKQEQIDNALGEARLATAAAEVAQIKGDPVGPKLLIQCTLAEGGMLFGAGKWGDATALYLSVAPLAEAQEEHILAMEGWRMAAYCCEMEENYDGSVEYGMNALRVGENLDEPDRPSSTLPYVGQGLLRVIEKDPHGDHPRPDQIRHKMAALCGSDWEERLVDGQVQPGASQP